MNETVSSGFVALGVHKNLAWRLEQHGIIIPTPIQAGSIPVALGGQDVIGLAQTGTGKTLAFGIPMSLSLGRGKVGLVLAPTRELAQQICESLAILDMQTVLVVGGSPMGRQVRELRMPHDVVVATPGRLMDHMRQKTYRLNRVQIVVLDEADRMLDMGFAPDIEQILAASPEERQTMLFSATMPGEIEDLSGKFLRSPERIEVAPQGSASELVDQELVYLRHEAKFEALNDALSKAEGTVLVFTRTRHGARKLALGLREWGHTAAEIHADRTLAQRREALGGFKNGRYRILVATDIAARGIDVKDISLVVNYDVPEHAEDYVHRIGRTGRAGAKGRSVTLALTNQKRLIRNIERVMGDRIKEVREVLADLEPHAVYHRERPIQDDREMDRPVRQEREDRPSRQERDERHERGRFERPERSSTRNRDDRPAPQNRDRFGRNDRPVRDESRSERFDRNDRPAQFDGRERNDRPQRFERDARPERGELNNRERYSRGNENRGFEQRGRDDRGFDNRGSDFRGFQDRGFSDRGRDDRRNDHPAWNQFDRPQRDDRGSYSDDRRRDERPDYSRGPGEIRRKVTQGKNGRKFVTERPEKRKTWNKGPIDKVRRQKGDVLSPNERSGGARELLIPESGAEGVKKGHRKGGFEASAPPKKARHRDGGKVGGKPAWVGKTVKVRKKKKK